MSSYETYLMIKRATFDLPDLQTNPRNKITRLIKDLKWGVRVDGKPISQDGLLFNPDPKKTYESISDENSNIASCVDLTNRVVKNVPGVGSLATMRSDGTIPHLTPMFKYKGKYYLRSGSHKWSDPYDTLDEVGDRWFMHDTGYPVPAYIDFYDLPAGTLIDEKDLRKVINEIRQKAQKTYRKDYTNRPLYKEKKASRLYTYVDPNADLSQGLLSLRNAPEDAVVRRYGTHVKDPMNRNKEYILKHFEIPGYGFNRPDLIFALDAPIPDNANEKLLKFRETHKLVSWDPAQVKDLVRIVRRYHPKQQEEVSVDFEPLKHVQWGRLSKDRTTFRHAPVYKILTESGKIPSELLSYE